jgi:hypothetical protein
VVRAHTDLQRMAKCFFMPELLKMEEALAVLKKPR